MGIGRNVDLVQRRVQGLINQVQEGAEVQVHASHNGALQRQKVNIIVRPRLAEGDHPRVPANVGWHPAELLLRSLAQKLQEPGVACADKAHRHSDNTMKTTIYYWPAATDREEIDADRSTNRAESLLQQVEANYEAKAEECERTQMRMMAMTLDHRKQIDELTYQLEQFRGDVPASQPEKPVAEVPMDSESFSERTQDDELEDTEDLCSTLDSMKQDADCLARAHQYEDASRLYDDTLRLLDQHGTALPAEWMISIGLKCQLNISLCLLKMQRYAKCIDVLRLADDVPIFNLVTPIQRAKALYRRGCAKEGLGDHAGALPDFAISLLITADTEVLRAYQRARERTATDRCGAVTH